MPQQDFDWQAILDTYRQMSEAANTANEQRYGQIMQTIATTQDKVGQRYSEIMDFMDTIGGAGMERIGQAGQRALATADQDLISRGLGQTTVRSAVQRGITEDMSRAEREQAEQTAKQRADVMKSQVGAEERMGTFLAQMQEARTDRGPDAGLMAQLMSQVGMGQGLGGGAGGGVSRQKSKTFLGATDTGPPKYGPGGSAGWGSQGGGGGGPATPGEIIYGPTGAATPPTPATPAQPAATGQPTPTPTTPGAPTPGGGGGGTGSVSFTIYAGSKADQPYGTTRKITVQASDLGSGPGGFKDEATYLRLIPYGWSSMPKE